MTTSTTLNVEKWTTDCWTKEKWKDKLTPLPLGEVRVCCWVVEMSAEHRFCTRVEVVGKHQSWSRKFFKFHCKWPEWRAANKDVHCTYNGLQRLLWWRPPSGLQRWNAEFSSTCPPASCTWCWLGGNLQTWWSNATDEVVDENTFIAKAHFCIQN